METHISGFTFFSNFDSGNLQKVEIDDSEEDTGNDEESASEKSKTTASEELTPRKSNSRRQKKSIPEKPPLGPTDFSFKIWTRPDCFGTEFENANRTWFYFGFRGSPQLFVNGPKVVKFTVMNLNKQSKLFSQGMAPIALVVPQSGQVPSYHSQPNGGWERIRERPTFSTSGNAEAGTNNFIMSFRVLCEAGTTTYIAFTYPYSYKDLQNFLGRIEKRHGSLSEKPFEALSKQPPNSIYFHRENICYSLQKRRIDLLTISSLGGILPEREDKLDKLFPEHGTVNDKGRQILRPFKFAPSKKTVFVSARVHPGETQSSFVINGFLRFLLRESDPRAVALRKKYVFKLIPMLNPDGVVNGHYRTDCRGVNLNRVYGRPVFELHPQIFASRKLLLYAHHRKEIFENFQSEESKDSVKQEQSEAEDKISGSEPGLSFNSLQSASSSKQDMDLSTVGSSTSTDSLFSSAAATSTPSKFLTNHLGYEMTETSRFSEGDESIADFSERLGFGVSSSPQKAVLIGPTTFTAAFAQTATPISPARRRRLSFGRDEFLSSAKKSTASDFGENPEREDANKNVVGVGLDDEPESPNLVAQEENANLDFAEKFVRPTAFTIPVNDFFYKHKRCQSAKEDNDEENKDENIENAQDQRSVNIEAPAWDPKTSGLFLYVDIHGHASKRGIFMYGNYFNEIETQAAGMLLPKLMSINCANFDFPACNFTERNMYLKDRHTGAGREGSGRVSVYKSTGLIHSYTLECNFNTGRMVNGIPMASRDAGRATPPPPPHPLPHMNPGTGTTPNAVLQDQVAPKYTPEIYEDAGKALATSILDLTESNPWTRLTCSAFKNLRGVREWLRKYIRAAKSAENEANGEREGRRSRLGRRRSTNSESSIKMGHHSKLSPMKADFSSPTRALRSSVRRTRASSASGSILSTRKSSASTAASIVPTSPAASYQPLTKLARKNSGKVQLPQDGPVATFNVKLSEVSASMETRLVKSSSVPAKKGSGNRKGKRSRSGSAGRSKPESQSCPSSRPSSSFTQTSRPSSPHDSASPTSPRSPRRSLSFSSLKRSKSRPNSPSHSGPSSPVSGSILSLTRTSSLKSVAPKKKSFRKSSKGQNTDNNESFEAGSPKMTPKKKLKMNQGKKKSKSLKKAKIIISAAAGLNPLNF